MWKLVAKIIVNDFASWKSVCKLLLYAVLLKVQFVYRSMGYAQTLGYYNYIFIFERSCGN